MRKYLFALVFGALLVPDAGFTVGLGEIQVNSALNQELDADIALLSTTPADAEQMIVKLATSEEFNRAGIDRPYLLTSLRFKVREVNGQPFIKVTSPRPIREPFLNFLVEIDWPQGRLLREYTILLDPPVFMGATQAMPAAQADFSRPAAADAFRPAATTAPPAAAPAPTTSWTPPPQAQPTTMAAAPADSMQAAPITRPAYAPSDGHRVQQGDTAWSLASAMRPDDSVTVEQMMMAMLRTNPEVFINGNVNGLKRGYILRMPDRAAMGELPHNEAVALVREQNALWREYQAALAGGVPASSIATDAEGVTAAGVEDTEESRLNIVSAGTGTGIAGDKDPTEMTAAELRAQLAIANEQLETERLEKEALVGKVERLEGQVDKMKQMLTIEDQDLADMQEAATPDVMVDEAAPEMPVAEDMVEDVAPVEEDTMADMPAMTEEDMAAPDMEQVEEVTEEPVFVDETAVEEMQVEQPPAEEMVPPDAGREFMDTMPDDFVTPAKPDPLEVIMSNPVVMAGIAFVVALLAGLGAFFVRRSRKKKAEAAAAASATAATALPVEDELENVADMVEDEALAEEISDELVEASMAEAEAEAEAAEEGEFGAESTMILPSAEDTVVTPMEEEAEEERDDVIAEADVYLAYGIYQQAEELLNNAIAEHPDRDAYRVKLAETQYAGKNADGFIEAARGLKEQSGIDTRAWAKVAAMGKDLCPDNEMFQATTVTGGVDLDELMPKAPEMDIDLDSGGEEAAAPDLDFSLDEAPELDLPEAGDDTALLDLGEAEPAAEPAAELEFDLSEAEAIEEAPAAEEEFSLDIGADELDLDIETEETPAVAEPAGEDAIDLSEELQDTGAFDLEEAASEVAEAAEDEVLDLGIELDAEEVGAEVAAEPALEEPSLEEMDLGLDLEQAAEELAPAAEEVEAEVEEALDLGLDEAVEAVGEAEEEILDLGEDLSDDLGDLGDVDEVGTKLDLARAYLDMGDAEGTRSILDEVMAEGNDDQKKEAEEILNQL